MKRSPKPIVKELPAVNFENVDLAFWAQAINSAGVIRVTIPRAQLVGWRIQPGDNLHVKITRIERRREA